MAKTINFIYLVPSDREINPQYLVDYESAALLFRDFIATQTSDGDTVLLNDPVITVVESTQTASWFDTNDNSGCTAGSEILCNCKDELEAEEGITLPVTDNLYHIMVDSPDDNFTDGVGIANGTEGYAITQPTWLQYFSKASWDQNRNPVNATMAHEIGHLFGFNHGANDDTLMMPGAGHCNFMDLDPVQTPDCAFRTSEKADLDADGWCETTPLTNKQVTNLASFQGMASI